VIKDTNRLQMIIIEAARATKTRIVVQSSWSKLDVSGERLCHNVGPVAHDWLLPLCCAVVHHGGAGTTAAGLRHGLPNFVCPFFGDQYMWGAMVHRAGVGPEPCPVDKLTADVLADKLRELTSESIRTKTLELAENMGLENGVLAGLRHFCESLPVDNMVCDVSLVLGETVLARYAIRRGRIHISREVASRLSASKRESVSGVIDVEEGIRAWWRSLDPFKNDKFSVHGKTTYAIGLQSGHSFARGLIGACSESTRLFLKALFQFILRPDKLARSLGLIGCLCGFLLFPFYTVFFLLKAAAVFVDRVVVAVVNGCFGKQWINMIEETTKKVSVPFNETMCLQRSMDISKATMLAESALMLFNECKPRFSENEWHFLEVPTETLLSVLLESSNKVSRIDLNNKEHETLCGKVKAYMDRNTPKSDFISFSRLCLFLGDAARERFLPRDEEVCSMDITGDEEVSV